jgi:hypothetical protein
VRCALKKFVAFLVVFLSAVVLAPARVMASNATPVTVSSTTVSGSIVTVNTSAANGLAVDQGMCLSSGTCGVVATTPTGTQFTFTSPGAAACASSCGTVSPAPRVVWLATNTISGQYQVNYVLWLTTTTPVPGSGSSAWTSATTAQKSALSAGYFIEIVRSVIFPFGTTEANVEAQMQNDYVAQQSALASSVQPGTFYGDVYDGTGWTE